MLVYTFYFIA